MTARATSPPPESKGGGLWILAAAPTVWAAHFLLAYVTAAVWCAKAVERGGPLGGARTAIAAYTVVALFAIAWIGVRAWARHHTGEAPHDADTPEDRDRFLGFAALLLAGLSAVAVVYAALAAVFIGSCH